MQVKVTDREEGGYNVLLTHGFLQDAVFISPEIVADIPMLIKLCHLRGSESTLAWIEDDRYLKCNTQEK